MVYEYRTIRNAKGFGLIPLIAAVVVLCICGVVLAERPKSLQDLTGPWQLFVDDYLVAEKSKVIRHYHTFEKYPGNPVITPTEPWEGSSVYGGFVMPDEDGSGYRLWYGCYDKEGPGYRQLYATSEDGIHWEKPNLGTVEYKGSKENNIYIDRPLEAGGVSIIHTPWDKGREYKHINFDYGRTPPKYTVRGYWAAYSSDGIHFTDLSDGPVLLDQGDVGEFAWDPHTGRYIGYPKAFAPVRGYRRRCVGFAATEDFGDWHPAELILVPDKFDDRWVIEDKQHTDLYGLVGFAYESMYIGFLRPFRIIDGESGGPLFVELVSSHDGINWVREEGDRPRILSVSRPGTWQDGMVSISSPPLVEGDRIKVWYTGMSIGHGGNVEHAIYAGGLATLRKDGFASLDAGGTEGTVTTKLLSNIHGQLHVNAFVDKGGYLKAEVVDREGEVVEGYGRDDCNPVTGEGVDQILTWKSKKFLPGGGAKRLRFIFQSTCLYSFKAGDDVKPAERCPPMKAFYTFDGEDFCSPADTACEDGAQQLCMHGAVHIVKDEDKAYRGCGSVEFTGDKSLLEIRDTLHLGKEFTLCAMVKPAENRRMRLFSTYRGTGAWATGELIFDFEAGSGKLRFIVNGQKVEGSGEAFNDGRYHHLAAVYNKGRVSLYLDGGKIGSGGIKAGTTAIYVKPEVVRRLREQAGESWAGVHLASVLRVGNDVGGRFIASRFRSPLYSKNEAQFVGWMDDLLVFGKALKGGQLAELSKGNADKI